MFCTLLARSSPLFHSVVRTSPGGLVLFLLFIMGSYEAWAAPTITSQPKPAVVLRGSNHTFQVVASGVTGLNYQWRFQAGNLPGETNPSLSLTDIQTSNAGPYSVVVSDSSGAVTSAVAHLTVRLPDAPVYAAPSGGWTYRYEGSTVAITDAAALDGTWNHNNGSDSWAYDGRGTGDGILGGVGTTNGILTLEDNLAAGAGVDNRRFYFTHALGQDGVTNSTILNDGVTLSFRARLSPPTDPLIEMVDAPNGFINAFDGKGMIGLRQVGSSGSIISFSLNRANEDTNATTIYGFPAAGLHVNNLNGNTRGPQVDPGEGGTLNVLELDPTSFHEFWITIQDNGADPGTHRVTIYVDGSKVATNFNVTAGSGFDVSTNYLAIGLPSVLQRAAFDLDYLAYRPGVHSPMRVDEPVSIVSQPTNQLVLDGASVTFAVSVTGTPPIAFQWYRNGELIPGATAPSFSISSASAVDNGAQYTVLVSNVANVEMSVPATLSVLGITAPSIVAHPLSLTVTNGDLAVFQVTALGTPPLSYQWRRDGTNVTGATSAVLAIANASPADTGSYDVVVSNAGGSTTSSAASLQVSVFDFGDAPSPLPSALTQNGARHLVVPGIHLGTSVDYELDARVTDSDDGVTFLSLLRAGQNAQVQIVTTSDGILNAWIDFDGNGSWAEGADQVFSNRVMTAGTNVLVLAIPPNAGGNAWARFRFGTASNVPPTGAAADGEVEDYSVAIDPTADVTISATVTAGPIALGSSVPYLVAVSNAGPSVATQIVVTNLASGGVTVANIVATQGSCTQESGVINCAIGTLASGASAAITFNAQPLAEGSLINTFFVRAAVEDPVLVNNVAATSTLVEVAPGISAEPQSTTVPQGQTAQFTVGAAGTAPLRFQWFHNDVVLAGATSNVLTIVSAQTANAGTYRVQVTNGVGVVLSQSATLTVLVPPTILQEPPHQTNLVGSTAAFQVVASGAEPLSYQWFFNATNALATRTNATLVITNLQLAQAGDYSVSVSNAAGTAMSAVARLQVIPMDFGDALSPFPTLLSDNGARHRIVSGFHLGNSIDAEPEGGPDDGDDGLGSVSAFLVGQTADLELVASSNGVLNAWLDWNGNGTWGDVGEQVLTDRLLTTGTNALVLSVPVTAQGGQRALRLRFSSVPVISYTGEAPDGEVEDYLVQVTALADLGVHVTLQPNPVTVGSNLTYLLAFTNVGPSTASGVVLRSVFPPSIDVISATSDQGGCLNASGEILCDLGVVPSGGGGRVTFVTVPTAPGLLEATFSLDAIEADPFPDDNQFSTLSSAFIFPQIVTSPQSLTVTNGAPASFSVSASGTSLAFQWLFEGSPVPGATNSTYTVSSAGTAEAGVYRVRVFNAVGEVLSASAQLTVLQPPVITSHPTGLSVTLSQSASFTVVASGSAPLAYQWSRDGTDLPGAIGATLTINSATSTDEGSYRVRVSNAAGEVLSNPAQLTVVAPLVITTQPANQSLFAGENLNLQVAATGTGPLNYQWYFSNGPLAGANGASLTISNAQGSQSGDYYVMINNAASSATSAVARVTITEADFGDAQGLDYSTLRVFNAAYHTIVPGFRLGTRIDFETDGQPNATATGDDLTGEDDEDGVRFPAPLLVGQIATCEVIASTNGFVDAWIDFDGNGNWVDPGEQIFTARSVTPGTNNLAFGVLANASAQNAVARFRFSSTGNLAFSGPAADGEVEDYLVPIVPAIDLSVNVQDTPDPVGVGTNLSLAITVANNGASLATGVALRDVLPSNVTFLSATPSQGACSNVAGTIHCSLGQLAGGASALVTVQMTPQRIGLIEHRLEVSGNETEVTVTNNLRIEPTSVISVSDAFRDASAITLPDGPAGTFPSTLNVSGVPGTVQKVILTLHDLTHAFPDDLDILLVGPGGQTAVVMSDAGGGNALSFVTLTFDEDSPLNLPDNGRLVSQAYRTSNYEGTGDVFPSPAPPLPYGSNLNIFKGSNPNGVWSLYIYDDVSGEGGALSGGWSLQFQALEPIADIAVGITATPQPVEPGQSLIVGLAVTNLGPATARRVLLTNSLIGNYALQSLTTTHGACTNTGLEIVCDFGSMSNGTVANVSATVVGTIQFMTNQVVAWGSERDFSVANNAASGLILIGTPPFIIGQPTNLTVIIGTTATFQATAGGTAPLQFQWRKDGVDLLSATNSSLILTNAIPSMDGAYSVIVVNGVGSVTSQVATLVVDARPTISSLPDLELLEDVSSPEVSFTIGDFETSAAALELVAASSNLSLIPVGNVVFGGAASNRTVRVSPAADQSGTSLITITVRDAQGATASDSFQVTVAAVNDSPSVSAISDQVVLEDGSVTIPVSITDVETPSGDLLITVSSDNDLLIPSSTLVLAGTGADRTLPIQPVAETHGQAMISVRADDGAGGITTRTFVVTVIPVNDPPTGTIATTLTIDEDGPEATIALANVGPGATNENQTVVVTATHNNSNLIASLIVDYSGGPTGVVRFVTLTNAFGEAAINLTLDDGGASNNLVTRTVNLTVNSINDLPVISDIGDISLLEDAPGAELSFSIADVETSAEGLDVTGISSNPILLPVQNIVFSGTGNSRTVRVIPTANQSGSAIVTVEVRDGAGAVVTENFNVMVTPENDAPTISTLSNHVVPEDGEIALPFTISDAETTPDALVITVASSNTNLIAVSGPVISGVGESRTLTLSPAPDEFGLATLTVTVADTNGASATQTFELLVQPVNDPPSLNPLGDLLIAEESGGHEVVLLGISSGAPNESQTLFVTAAVAPSNLISNLNVAYAGGTTGLLSFVAIPNASGAATVTVSVDDGGASNNVVTRSFQVIISDVNDTPVLAAIPAQVSAEDVPVLVPLLYSDPETPAALLNVSVTSGNTNLIDAAGLTLSNNVLTLTPKLHEFGSAQIVVSVTDASNAVATQTFEFVVSSVNDAPTLDPIGDLSIGEDAPPQTVALVNLTSGALNEAQPLLVRASSSNPSLIPNPRVSVVPAENRGTLSFTPAANISGTALITVTVDDLSASNNTVVRTFAINVSNVNDLPIISQVLNQATLEGVPLQVSFTIADAETLPAGLQVAVTASNTLLLPPGSLVPGGTEGNRTLQINPASGVAGESTISLVVSDADGGSSSITFVLTVMGQNDAPAISDIADQQITEGAAVGPISFTVSDTETASENIQVVAHSSNAMLLPTANIVLDGTGATRTVTLNPIGNRSGSATITLTARDAEGALSSDSFVLSVLSSNAAPMISAIPDVSMNENSSLPLPFTVGDAETVFDLLTVAVSSTNVTLFPEGTLVLSGSGPDRILTLNPAMGQAGSAELTISVVDEGGATATETFLVQVVTTVSPVLITAHPSSQGIPAGNALSLSVAAVGSGPIHYQWLFENAPISGATNAVFTLPVAQTNNAGSYFVVLSNSLGSVTSAVAQITIIPQANALPPTISDITDQATPEDSIISIPFVIGDPDTPAHFLSVSVTSGNTSLVPSTNVVVHGAGNSRTLALVPAANLSGTSLITVTVSDGAGAASDSFLLTVNSLNDPPTLDPIPDLPAVRNNTTTVPLTGIGPGGPDELGALTVSVTSSNPSLIPTPTVSYAPGATSGSISLRPSSGTGVVTISVQVSDGQATTVRTFTAFVRANGNANPTITAVSDHTIPEDTSTGPIAITIGDSATAATSLSLTARASNTNLVPQGGIVLGGTGASRTITVTPAPNQSGITTIFLSVTDTEFGSAVTSFNLAVSSTNDAPSITSILDQSIQEDTATAPIAFAIGDLESRASLLVASATSSNPTLVSPASITFGGSGSNRVVVITPAPNQSGTAVIGVTVTDPQGGNATASLNLSVIEQNDAPLITAVDDIILASGESSQPVPFAISDLESPSNALTVTAASSNEELLPLSGIVIGGTDNDRTVTLSPAPNGSGIALVSLTVSDGSASATELFAVHVAGGSTNSPPTLDPVASIVIAEGSGPHSVLLTGISAGAGDSGQHFTVSAVSSNPDLVPHPVVNHASPGTAGSLILFANPGTNGVTQITVAVNDGVSLATQTFDVTVRGLPSISSLNDVVLVEDTVTDPLDFIVWDAETATTNLQVSASSSNPSLLPNANIILAAGESGRTVTLLPLADEFGFALVTLTVTDGDGLSASTQFGLLVSPVNDTPTLDSIPDQFITADQLPLAINLGGISSGAANESQPLMIAVSSSNPSLVPSPTVNYTSPSATGTLTLTSAGTGAGVATITVTATDGQLANQLFSRTFSVTVGGVENPPTLDVLSDLTIAEDSGTHDLVLTGIGPGEGNETQTVVVSAQSSDPSLVPHPSVAYTNGQSTAVLAFAPALNAFGSVVITVSVSDGVSIITESFAVNITAQPEVVTLSQVADQMFPEDSQPGPLTVIVTDDSAGTNVILTAVSLNPSLIRADDILVAGTGTERSITLRPATNQFGSATVILTAALVTGETATNSFEVIVTPVNDLPVISVISAQVVNEDASTLPIPFTVGDLETAPESLIVTAISSNSALVPDLNIVLSGTGSNRFLTATPAADQYGVTTIRVFVSDNDGGTNEIAFDLTVIDQNDAPPTLDALADVTINEGTGPHLVVLAGISAGPGDTQVLSVTAVSSNPALIPNPSVSYASPAAVGSLTFAANPATNGTVVISVTVSDGVELVTRSFTVTVAAVDDPPTIAAIPDITVDEDSGTHSIVLTGIGAGDVSEQQVLTISATSAAPAIVPDPLVVYTNGLSTALLSFAPALNATGSVIITVSVSDGANTATESFAIVVNGLPETLTLSPIADQTMDEDQFLGPLPVAVDDDSGGTNVVVTVQSSNAELFPAEAIILGGTGAERYVTLQPATNQFGNATITMVASLPSGESVTNSFAVLVNAVNDLPGVVPEMADQSLAEDASMTVQFSVSDVETSSGELTVEGFSSIDALLGSTTMVFCGSGADRTLMLTPALNQHGTSLIQIIVRDADGGRATNQFTLTVTPVADPPTIGELADRFINEDQETQLTFLVDDPDRTGSLTVTARSSNLSLVDTPQLQLFGVRELRVLRVAPRPDRHGISIITVTVRDESGLEASQSFLLSVTAVNDPPMISAIPNLQGDANSIIGPIAVQVSDKENFPEELTLFGHSSNTNLIPLSGIILSGFGADRAVAVAPAANQSGYAIITVEVADGNGAMSATQFEVVVHQTNGAPIIVRQPEDAAAFAGASLGLRVIATGPAPLSYQWQFDGADLPGAVGPELNFASIREEDAGAYRVIVTNGQGSVTSLSATVSVEHPPLVVTPRRVGDTFELSFPTSASRRYVLEFREMFDLSPWTVLGTFDGNGARLTIADPGPLTASRFYRVRIEETPVP